MKEVDIHSDGEPLDEASANLLALIEFCHVLEARDANRRQRALGAKLLDEQDESPSARSE